MCVETNKFCFFFEKWGSLNEVSLNISISVYIYAHSFHFWNPKKKHLENVSINDATILIQSRETIQNCSPFLNIRCII